MGTAAQEFHDNELMLNKLNIREEVQMYFKNDYTINSHGDLVFCYGNACEYYGARGHQTPFTHELWVAGNKNFHLTRQVFICSSAMEAMAFFSLRYDSFPQKDFLLFIAIGTSPKKTQYQALRELVRMKKVALVMGNDFFGRLCDIKIVAGIKEIILNLYMINEQRINVQLSGKGFQFEQSILTLNALEKASGLRSAA